jgi:hypothetical protein
MTTSEDRSSDTTPLAGRVDAAAGAAFASAADLAGAAPRMTIVDMPRPTGPTDAQIRNLPG